MTNFLVKKFVKNYEDVKNVYVRQAYGNLASIIAIIINFLLFVAKFIVGTFANSVSIVADSVNNLSDMGSAVISAISFKLALKPADKEHPYGHARIEYLSALAVGIIIILLGFELGKSSIKAIFYPIKTTFSLTTVIILVMSVLAKLWLSLFNKKLGKKIESELMLATAADSLSDVLSTTAVLVSTVLSLFLPFSLDGIMGTIVSILILVSGIGIIKDTINKLLGDAPSKELVDKITDFVMSYDGIIGVHDLMIHDYGPGRCFVSLHAEVSSKVNVIESHDLIDDIERDIKEKENIFLVLHMDPIATENKELQLMIKEISDFLKTIDKNLSLHDFRAVGGATHTNLVFDVVIPYSLEISDSEILAKINAFVEETYEDAYAVVTFDHSFS